MPRCDTTGPGHYLGMVVLLGLYTAVSALPLSPGKNPPSDEQSVPSMVRVINGVDVRDPNEYPFVADLSLDRNLVSSTRYCTGSLIKPNIVLTAAHCVLNHGEMGDGSFVAIGRINLKDDHESNTNSETFRAVAGYVHPDYLGLGSNADIALLLLDGVSKRRPVELASISPETNSTAWVVGYGIQDMGTIEGSGQAVAVMPKRMQKSALRIMDRTFCNGIDLETLPGMLCTAGLIGGSSACRGDSGGGLFFEDKNGIKTQVGVVSYGDASCMSDNGGIFTDVSAVREWIQEGTLRLQALLSTQQPLHVRRHRNDSLMKVFHINSFEVSAASPILTASLT
jgi:trypsin